MQINYQNIFTKKNYQKLTKLNRKHKHKHKHNTIVLTFKLKNYIFDLSEKMINGYGLLFIKS